MFIKEAVANVGRKFLNEKVMQKLQQSLIVHFVFFTTLKDYLYKYAAAAQNLFVVPEQIRERASRKKFILVLDMDETLVYTRRSAAPRHSNYIQTEFDGSCMYVEPRPHAKEFLKAVSQIFTVYVYTAGKKKYADSVLDSLDPEGFIQRRFYRDSCRKVNGNIVKDLRYLKRSLKTKSEMILIDDNTHSIENNYPFALKIKAFEGEQDDQELISTFNTVLKFYC